MTVIFHSCTSSVRLGLLFAAEYALTRLQEGMSVISVAAALNVTRHDIYLHVNQWNDQLLPNQQGYRDFYHKHINME